MDCSQAEKTAVKEEEMTGIPCIQQASAADCLGRGYFAGSIHSPVDLGRYEVIAISGFGAAIVMNEPGIVCSLQWSETTGLVVTHEPEITEFAHFTLIRGDGRIAGS